MPTTPIYALPYPAATDPADVPLDMQELAERVEAIAQPLAYVERTTSLTVTTTVQQFVSAGAITYEAQPILIEFFAARCNSNAATMAVQLFDASTNLGDLAVFTGAIEAPGRAARRLTPTAGSHTYRIQALMSAGTGTIWAGAGGPGGAMPAFIRITRA
jgi:hypothetical protein